MRKTFKDYLLEYAMGEKALSKAVSTKAKVGFEFELIFSLEDYGNGDKTGQLTLDDLEDYYDLNRWFDILSRTSRDIFSDMDKWIDGKEEEYVQDNYKDYIDNDTDKDAAMDKARDSFNRDDFNVDDYIKAEFPAHRSRYVSIAWERFIDHHNLEPTFGWVEGEPNTFYTEKIKKYDSEKVQSAIAKDFADRMGIKNVKSSNTYHGLNKTDNWVVEIDSSIDCDESIEHACEIVSPPMDIIEGLDAFANAMKTFERMAASTNSSTGLHINISLEGKPQIDFLKLVLLLGEQYELKKYFREMNRYAKSHIKSIITSSKKYMSMIDSDMNIKDIQDIIHSFSTRMLVEKYAAVNFENYNEKGYVEFRIPGGNYMEMNPSEIVKTIKRFVVVLSTAASPTEAKQDYYKKIYKLLDTVIHGEAEETVKVSKTDQYKRIFDDYPMLSNLIKKIPDTETIIKKIADQAGIAGSRNIVRDNIIILLDKLAKFLKNTNQKVNAKQTLELKQFLKYYSIDIKNRLF